MNQLKLSAQHLQWEIIQLVARNLVILVRLKFLWRKTAALRLRKQPLQHNRGRCNTTLHSTTQICWWEHWVFIFFHTGAVKKEEKRGRPSSACSLSSERLLLSSISLLPFLLFPKCSPFSFPLPYNPLLWPDFTALHLQTLLMCFGGEELDLSPLFVSSRLSWCCL